MVSAAASLMPVIMRIRGSKRANRSRESALAGILENRAYAGAPRLRGVDVRRDDDVITIAPPSATGVELLWFHGGSYVSDFAPQHFAFLRRLALATGATIHAQVYELAPHQTAERTVARAAALLERHPDALVGGDSAGGGLAVAASLAVGSRRSLLLLSPWLDIRLTDPAIASLEPRDPWLSVTGLRVAGELYRGELSDDDPRVSPLLADLSGLGPSLIVCGDRDILLADSRAFAAKAPNSELHVARGMLHVFPLLPIPEARPAVELFASRLRTAAR